MTFFIVSKSINKSITACSATLTVLLPVTSTTPMLCSLAAAKSTWSDPTPAVIANFKFGAFQYVHASYMQDKMAH